MAFGMKLPQGDKTAKSARKTKVDPATMMKNATAPLMPQRDGPAKDAPNGKIAGKPPTSAKAKGPIDMKKLKAMKASLGGVGRF